MKKNILPILVAAATALPILSRAQITNPGFESGLTGWTITAGDTANTLSDFSTATSLPGYPGNLANTVVNPTQASNFGLISDSLLNYNSFGDTETVSQTFNINTAGTLSLNYRFTTEAVNQPTFNPNAQITLTIGANTFTLANVSRNNLQAGGAGSLLSGAAYFVGDDTSDIGQNAWQTASFNLSSYVGQNATLALSVSQDYGDIVGGPGDTFSTDQLAVDNVQVAPVPEPTTGGLLVGGLALLAINKFRRKNS
jgi:hypothetical protein